MPKALLKYPVEALSGQVNKDAVHMRTGGRNMLRAWVNPTNPNTTAQQEVRAHLASVAAAYKALSAAEIDAWRVLGLAIARTDPLQQAYSLSAIQAFIATNTYRLMQGLAILEAAPVYPPVAAVPYPSDINVPVTLVGTVLTVNIEYDNPSAINGVTFIRVTPAMPTPTRRPRITDLRVSPTDASDAFFAPSASPTAHALNVERFTLGVGDSIGVYAQMLTPEGVPIYAPIYRLTPPMVIEAP